MANRRAKTLDKPQFDALLEVVKDSEHALRDEVAIRLSYDAGLRACEIAGLRWNNNLLDAKGKLRDVIHITGDVAKRSVERTLPMHPKLAAALKALRKMRPNDEYVFYALHNYQTPTVFKLDAVGRRMKKAGAYVKVPDPDFIPGKVQPNAVVQWFKRLYAMAEYKGCSSHSGRRTFVTVRARLANLKECSIEDVRILAGHKRLDTTAGYIEPSDHQRSLVEAW